MVHLGSLLPGDDQGAYRSGDLGKTDNLHGLKENVIIGRLVPAGTGMSRRKNIGIQVEGQEDDEAEPLAVGGLVETSTADTVTLVPEAPAEGEGAPSV